MKQISLNVTFIVAVVLLSNITNLQAESLREQLNALVTQLQENPGDNALREQIIKLAQSIDPSPAVPEEAERRMARGNAAFKDATSENAYREAAQEYEAATNAAPWYGEAYYNRGLALDKAGDHAAAIQSLKLALLAVPDSREAKSLLYEAEYRLEKANSPEAQAEGAADRDRKFLASLEGAVWTSEIISTPMEPSLNGGHNFLYGRTGYEVHNGQIQRMSGVGWWPEASEPPLAKGGVSESFPLSARHMDVNWQHIMDASCNPYTLQISEDGRILTETYRCYGKTQSYNYTRKP